MPSFNDNVVNALKEYYDGQKIGNSLFRNSPLLAKIEKKRVGGNSYPVPFLTSGSGASCGSMNKFISKVSQWGKTEQMKIDYGQIFGGFTLSQKEYSASIKDAGSFVDLLTLKSFASLESIRKVFAVSLFGKGDGFLGKVTANYTADAKTITVENRVAMGIGIGSEVIIRKSNGSPAQGIVTITGIEIGDSATKLTFTLNDGEHTPGITVSTDTGEIYLNGCVNGEIGVGNPLLPVGLDGWIPTVADRTGTTWDSYIKKPFFGVDRSNFVTRLSGQFVKKGSSEKITDAIMRLISKIRTQGGVPDTIVLNPADYETVMREMNTQLNYIQAVNGSDKRTKNEVAQGISQMSFAFSTSWVQNVIDDPFCPQGKIYVLDSSVVKFVALSNTAPIVNASVASENAGTPEIAGSTKAPDNYIFNYDDFVSTQPVNTDEGAGLMAIEQVFGNFVLTNPAHCGVCVF